MDAKEVKTHVAELEKAVRDKLPSAQLIDILNSLKRQVVATESLLRVSRLFSVVVVVVFLVRLLTMRLFVRMCDDDADCRCLRKPKLVWPSISSA